MLYWLVLDGGNGRYLVVLGHYTLVLVGTWWYRVSVELFLPVYIEEKIGRVLPIPHRHTDNKI